MLGLPWRRLQWDQVVDLSRVSTFTLSLLDDPWAWRQRVVEEMELGSADHVRETSSFQLELTRDLLRPHVLGRPRWARVLLPLTTRDKRPLLRFDLEGPAAGPAHLLKRNGIASLCADHLERLAAQSRSARLIVPGLPRGLLQAVCIASPTAYRTLMERSRRPDAALAAYLSRGLGLAIDPVRVARWHQQQQDVGMILAGVLAEEPDAASAAENILVALPRISPHPRDLDEVEAVVAGYRRAVRAAADAGDERLLMTLAEYGRRYQLMIVVTAPIGEPFTVRVAEQRPLGLTRHGWTFHRIPMREARSFHFEARVDDPALEITGFQLYDLDGREVGIPPLDAKRATRELLGLYSGDPGRPRMVDIGLRLRPTREVRITAWAVAGLAWIAAVVALLVPADDGFAEVLNLLAVPTTFAIAFVLLREQTSLSARLQRPTRAGLGVAIAVLWGTALIRLLP